MCVDNFQSCLVNNRFLYSYKLLGDNTIFQVSILISTRCQLIMKWGVSLCWVVNLLGRPFKDPVAKTMLMVNCMLLNVLNIFEIGI